MIRTLFISLCLAAAGGVFAEASAQQFDPRSRYSADDARDAREAGEFIPAREIARRMRFRYPNADVRVADLIVERGAFYIVRVITVDGRRLDVYIDARNGATIPERRLRAYRD